ncbi:MAG: CAP domain-containing protein [Cyclobacteriaceae bacterium]|nr:CAP domain-containing protein [Cyclobacteriaceae bacterium]
MLSSCIPLVFLFHALFGITENIPDTQTCLSKEELELNKLITKYRKQNGLPAIPLSHKLTQVAQAHAKDLDENYDFDPNNTCNPHSWSDQGSWKACCYTNDHKSPECMWEKPAEISGYSGHGYEIAFYHSDMATANTSLEGWKKSTAHNNVLLNKAIWKEITWNAIGIGIYGKHSTVWFGRESDDGQPGRCD